MNTYFEQSNFRSIRNKQNRNKQKDKINDCYTINFTIVKFLNKPSIQKEKLIRECEYTNDTPINMFRHGSVRDLLINNYLNT